MYLSAQSICPNFSKKVQNQTKGSVKNEKGNTHTYLGYGF